MKRRDVLKLAGAAGLAPLMPGCSDGPSGPGTIDTFVLLMLENRSYDHVFGARSFVEGLGGDGPQGNETNPDTGGSAVALWKGADGNLCVPDPAHGWDASHTQFNAGAMDGFLTTHQADHPGDLGAMQYLTRELMPVTYALADEYAICDRWFCSVMGPTWPNRFYWLSGQCEGAKDNSVAPGGYKSPLIFHRLDEAGVPWKLYFGAVPFFAVAGANIEGVQDKLWYLEDFYADAEKGQLPPVCYIDPPFTYGDDHPPHHPIYGQQLIASIYDALVKSPQWERTLFVVTYDEHGGFYDHVAPPTAPDDRAAEGFDQLGFRVPTLVVGPYVKRGHVSSVVRDHTSALKHLETTFGLEPLTMRSSAAADLSELIDEERLAAGDAGGRIVLPAVDVDEWQIDDACTGSSLREDHHILQEAQAHPERIVGLDRRDDDRTLARLINARARAASRP